MGNPIHYRPTKAIVDLQAIQHNLKNLQKHLGPNVSIIAVAKANGYGHGAVEVAKTALASGAALVAVATPDEAVQLREAGIMGDILVLGPSPLQFADRAAALGITVTVSSTEWLRSVVEGRPSPSFQKKLKVHVKIDTGMGRIGIRDAGDLSALIQMIDNSGDVELDGVFTHFARADEEDPRHTEKQFKVFMDLVNRFPAKPRLVHAANSAAALLYPEYALDAVRFGVSMYGLPPSAYVAERLPFRLEKTIQLITELSHVKMMEKGNPISYGGTYETAGDEWIGTLPIGYADGLRRSLQGQDVLVGGQRAPIVGTICMDQCMVRLPREFPIGEPVVLIGTQGDEEITMEEWAQRLDTIPYEIMVSFKERIPRIYATKNGQRV
ncbi:alanine racemase [Sporosarcina sp. 179-K 3D1 HS]|uniref:alanine racemase n=1 Tax=Sporosarcina sp. 179-K 3D1 HS TaxID=3232169 RepID=UPI00399F76E4